MKLRYLPIVVSWCLLELVVASLWLLIAPAGAAPAIELTVCPAGPPDCQYSSVQDAVDAAGEGDIIKVAAGVYTGVNHDGGLAQMVHISRTVTIRGGYVSPHFAQPPDPEANPTTLDARGQGRVLYIVGEIQPTIEGLHITGGDATGLGGSSVGWCDAGGGVYIVTAAATLSGNHVTGNKAGCGGGLHLSHSQATLRRNSVASNTATYWGGGLDLYVSPATLNRNTVSGNTASESGGLSLYESDALLKENTISGNTAGDYGGGGLSLFGSEATLSENTISDNSAGFGGGLSLFYSSATLEGNTITSNIADHGGGLTLHASGATLSGNTISSNSAGRGGGLELHQSAATLTNNLVTENQVSSVGSALYIEASAPRFLHTTVARNYGGDGSGLYVTGWRPFFSTVALTNTIMVSHRVGITVAVGNTVRLEATLWGTGTWANEADFGGVGTILTGTANLWGDPAFRNPDVADYHLTKNSAAKDAGLNAGVTIDIDGEARPNGSGFDIGADECYPRYYIYLPLVHKDRRP